MAVHRTSRRKRLRAQKAKTNTRKATKKTKKVDADYREEAECHDTKMDEKKKKVMTQLSAEVDPGYKPSNRWSRLHCP